MLRFAILLLTAFLALPAALPLTTAQADDPVIDVPNDDAEMNAAIAKARESLPDFWEAWAAPPQGAGGFGLKVRIVDASGSEHFWTTDIEKKDGRIRATIANEPETVKSVTEGQRVEVPETDISDWMYWRDGKIVGNETLRVLLRKTPITGARFSTAPEETGPVL
jgi:uncharacterized protein YegJ (DUF2314 family)